MMLSKKTHNHRPLKRRLSRWLLCCALGSTVVTGCRQRAYTELYIENMAGEIRLLEDRIYEYDAAYMEKDAGYESAVMQLERLKKKNAELERELELLQNSDSSPRKSPPLKLKATPQPNESIDLQSAVPFKMPAVLSPDSPKSEIIESPPVVSRTPVAPPASNSKPQNQDATDPVLPGSDSVLPAPVVPSKPFGSPEEPRAFNQSRPSNRNSVFPDADSLTQQVSLPETMVRSAQQPSLVVTPSRSGSSRSGSVQPEPLPSSSDPSSYPSQPRNVPSLLQKAFPKIKDGNTQGAIQRGMIRLPEGSKVQFASATEPVQNVKPTVVVDNRIVEIAFHPTLCRGHNFDEQPGDDGLYLVVTPINSTGQVLNETGSLTIVVEDEAETNDKGRIAAWEFTAEQLAETLEPIGTAQGFHLSLPWQDKRPTSKMVSVYLRFANANGRTLVNQRQVHLRPGTIGQSAWTPRNSSASK